MKDMMGGSYRAALRGAFVPEWLSMNMMAAGMFPVMIFLMMGRDMRAMDPPTPQFWAVMSLGVIVGFFVAYPVNVWMVAKNLKHGLMTARPTPAAGRIPRHSPAARGGPVMTATRHLSTPQPHGSAPAMPTHHARPRHRSPRDQAHRARPRAWLRGDPAPARRGHDPDRAGPRARRRDPGQPGQPRPSAARTSAAWSCPPE